MNMTMNITVTPSTDDACYLHLPLAPRAIFGAALMCVATLGTIGNSVLSFYVVRYTEMQSLINILLATMAVSDTLISLLCAPLDLTTILQGKWLFGKVMCLVHSFALSVLVVENVTMLVVISVDRYCMLVRKKDMLRKCRVAVLISGCTLFSIVVSCPPLFNSSRLIFANERCRRMSEKTDLSYLYSLLFSSFLFLLPCGLLLLAYVHIILIIRKRGRKIRPQPIHKMSVHTVELHVKFKQKTFSTILCLYAAAMLCKLPLAISILVQGLTSYKVCPLGHWILFLTYLNSALNPFIYAMKISEYWMMLTGKFNSMKNQVKSFRRKSFKRNDPRNIYMINVNSSSSVE